MEKKYTKDHEWISIDQDIITIGITDYAQNQLGDIVYVSLTKEVGESVESDDDVAEIESVKSVSQVYTPVSGSIEEFNTLLEDESKSGIINEDPYGKGWIIKIKMRNKSQLQGLLSEAEYEEFVNSL